MLPKPELPMKVTVKVRYDVYSMTCEHGKHTPQNFITKSLFLHWPEGRQMIPTRIWTITCKGPQGAGEAAACSREEEWVSWHKFQIMGPCEEVQCLWARWTISSYGQCTPQKRSTSYSQTRNSMGWLSYCYWDEEISPQYLTGLNLITRVHISERRKQSGWRCCGAGFEDGGGRPLVKECGDL